MDQIMEGSFEPMFIAAPEVQLGAGEVGEN